MCGIVGSFSLRHQDSLESRMVSALKTIQHRGPDDLGMESFSVKGGKLLLGHTRLSIIDLTDAGHQPMFSRDGRYVIVFNGEIYNYKELRKELIDLGSVFISDSDTEVLLAAWDNWKEDCLEKIIGMFSFVIFDREENSLYGARDAFGIKPLFYRYEEGRLDFASEIPAILELLENKPKPNWQNVYDYLVWARYDHKETSFFEGINHLLPGHFFKVSLNEKKMISLKRWWWPSINEQSDITFNQASEQLREMFLSSVKLHMRSDVPIGAALSGGLDSSAVVSAMNYIEPSSEIHTFSYVARNSVLNEEKWIDIMNNSVGAIPHKVVVSPNDILGDLDDLILLQGEPFASTSIYAQYRVFQAVKEEGIVVTLDGQGADELLAGYWGYPHARLKTLINQMHLKDAFDFSAAWTERHNMPWKEIINPALTASISPEIVFNLMKFFKTQPPKWIDQNWCNDNGVKLNSIYNWRRDLRENKTRVLSNTLRSALTGKMGLVHLLRHEDRNAMRWSVESRVPFLNTEIADFTLSLPERFLVSDTGQTKNIFRSAMKDIVPDIILNRQDKIGFETPETEWLKQFSPQLKEWLSSDNDLPIINKEMSIKWFHETVNKKQASSLQLWRLVNLSRWHKVFFEN